ncbi:MFS transporter [Sphingomonas cavernae]|nr:MFS transporter [Sphingomonas cavernae]
MTNATTYPFDDEAMEYPADTARAPASAWFALAVLVGATLFSFVDRQILALVAEPLRESLDLSDLQLGALQGLGLAIFAALASYPMGWLSDRYDRRLVLCAGILIWSCATAACAFQTSFEGLFASTVGIAVGEAGLAPIVLSIIPDIFPRRQRTLANFIYFTAALIGAAIGIGLGSVTLGWLTENVASLPGMLGELEPWRVAMIVVALPGPLFIALVAMLKVRRPQISAAHNGPADASTAATGLLPYVRQHWKTVFFIFSAMAAYNIGIGSTLIWIPAAIHRAFGVPLATVGLQLGAMLGVASIIGLICSGSALKFLPGDKALLPLRIATAAFVIAMAATFMLPLIQFHWQGLAIVGVQMGAGMGAAALMPGVLQDISPPHLRGRIISILSIVGAVAQGVSPMLVGAISTTINDPRGVLQALAIVATPGWLVAAYLIWRSVGACKRTLAILDVEH